MPRCGTAGGLMLSITSGEESIPELAHSRLSGRCLRQRHPATTFCAP